MCFVYCAICIECAEYQDAVYERVYSQIGLNGSPAEQKIFRCFISTIPLIVGGEKAQAKEFPHMVTIKHTNIELTKDYRMHFQIDNI